jgi:hypothetical protein
MRASTLQKREFNRDRLLLLLWSVPAVLLGAAAYELALAVGLIGSYAGLAPGEGIEGEETVAGVAALTMVVGVVLAGLHARRPHCPWAVALFAPAAAAFMIARFYTYDPYYLPTLRRYSDGGAVPTGWIFFMLAVSLAAGVSARARPRSGSVATALVLPFVLATFTLASDGH